MACGSGCTIAHLGLGGPVQGQPRTKVIIIIITIIIIIIQKLAANTSYSGSY